MAASWAPDVLPLFLELAAVPSPPGQERRVADRVIDYLQGLGLEVVEDDAGERVGSTAGNLLAKIAPVDGGRGGPLFLCAHLDTVAPTADIDPVVEDGIVRNRHEAILGADNKAAIAAMLSAARLLLAERRPHGGVELLFTVREESGCLGASAFDQSALAAQVGFVYDFEGPIGDVVIAAPYQRTIDAVFRGRAAHAGISPEEGRSAIVAAARAITDLRLGRIDDQTTANVGTIDGGIARNVVPDRCRLVCELRSRNKAQVDDLTAEVLETLSFAAAVEECEAKTQVEENYPGYRLSPDDLPIRLAREALECSGFSMRTIESNGGADANIFNGRSLPCVNLANGMSRIHSPEEEIAVADLEAMVGVTLELVEAARHA